MATDSERFYDTVLDLFDDVEEQAEVNELQTWWNWYDFTSILLHSNQLNYRHITARYSQTIQQLDVPFAKAVL